MTTLLSTSRYRKPKNFMLVFLPKEFLFFNCKNLLTFAVFQPIS